MDTDNHAHTIIVSYGQTAGDSNKIRRVVKRVSVYTVRMLTSVFGNNPTSPGTLRLVSGSVSCQERWTEDESFKVVVYTEQYGSLV